MIPEGVLRPKPSEPTGQNRTSSRAESPPVQTAVLHKRVSNAEISSTTINAVNRCVDAQFALSVPCELQAAKPLTRSSIAPSTSTTAQKRPTPSPYSSSPKTKPRKKLKRRILKQNRDFDSGSDEDELSPSSDESVRTHCQSHSLPLVQIPFTVAMPDLSADFLLGFYHLHTSRSDDR